MGELGQVFTSKNVATCMAELLVSENSSGGHTVLDPCIGPNTFLEELARLAPTFELHGVEIDASLITKATEEFYKVAGRHLKLGNFFEVSRASTQKFDLIIQNPPYVRHEKLTGLNDKHAIRALFADHPYDVPASSNLYVYFLLHSIDLLKKDGTLVAIVYDSWLHSKYGESLKNTLISLGSIKSVIHFQDGAFASAGVGATIIEFTKGAAQTTHIRYAEYADTSQLPPLKKIKWTTKSPTDLLRPTASFPQPSSILVPITAIADINRGTSALSNKLFVFKDRQFKETIPFLKNIKDITGMSALSDKHLLVVRENRQRETHAYLEKIKTLILDNKEKYQTLSKKVSTEQLWYSPRLAQPGDIIFNYYLRDNVDFLLNQKRLQSSDNFYNLRIHSHLFAHFALLNSSQVRQEVLRHSRSQGSGLRKIQIYEFKKIQVPNLTLFSSAHRDKLEVLGKQLARVARDSEDKRHLIADIDELITDALTPAPKTAPIDYTVIQYGQALV